MLETFPLRIRNEQPNDHEATEALALAAFAPDTRVAELVRKLRVSPRLVPELNLVAALNGIIIGHLMFSRAALSSGDDVALLSPLGVLPGYQKQGVGSALVRHALGWLERTAFPLVLLEGIPAYYPRFGFVSAYDLGIEPPYPVWRPAWQAYCLPSYREDVRGVVTYPEAFGFLHNAGDVDKTRQQPNDG